MTPPIETTTITYFSDYAAANKREVKQTLPELRAEILSSTAPKKADLPWLKLATFGDTRTEKNSLRHDANVLSVYGIEADYDAGTISFGEAVEKLTKAGILALAYTSPSHTPDKPRWRVLCFFSEPHEPAMRARFLGRLNGLFGGIFAPESWTLSQAYYYGSVGDNPHHQCEIIEGQPIDLHDDLDEISQGKPSTDSAVTGGTHSGPVNEAALLADIREGQSYHAVMTRLAGKWAFSGVPAMEARRRIVDAMEAVEAEKRDARWRARFDDINRVLLDIYGKQAAKKDEAHSELGAGGALRIVTAAQLLTRTFPPRELVLAPWLPAKGLAMIYGPRGIGKTLLTLGIAYAIASGGTFLGWRAPKARRVLVIDGEMPAQVLQERLAAVIERSEIEAPPDALRLLALDLQESDLDLSREDDQARLDSVVGDAEVLLVDNISTLARTGRENEAESWLPVQQWALWQRRAGRSVVFIHHAGKTGAQRGTSRREDVLDTVIALRRPDDYDPAQGARFQLHYEKSRGFHGNDAKPLEAALGPGGWTTRDLADADMARVVALSREGLSVRDIAETLGPGWSKSRVQRMLTNARAAGLTGEAGHA
jgi:KaiC/GvpD/RAD55 family RecA-like ATPase